MRQIGRYYVVEQLGAGAMGTVYRALDPTIGRTVAIKAIRLTDFADPAERERVRDRLLQEARAAGLLSHPNIITIYDVLEEESSAFIVMEFVEGPSLGDMLRGGQLPDSNRLLRYFGQIADALDYAHRKGVIHRDIKSANILISSEHDHSGLAKISDFGISKFISQDTTHSGTMIGTPSYMAPEQIQGLPADGRSDQFSFAVVVYEMLTGTKPFRGESLATLFYQVCKQEAPPPHELNPSLPAPVDEVIARGLAKDSAGRFPSCSDFVSALSKALNSSNMWHAATEGERETQTMVTLAAVAGASDAPVFGPPLEEEHERQPPDLSQSVPAIIVERPPETDLPPLPRRTRRQDGTDDAEDDRESSPWHMQRRVLLVFVGSAIAAVLVFLIARVFTREPSAPVVTKSTGQNAPPSLRPSESVRGRGMQPGSRATSNRSAAPANPGGSSAGGSMAPAVTSTSEVTIVTQPPGANVVVDNRAEGACHSPCTSLLPPGRHTLTADLKGFDTARRIFTVPEEKQLSVTMSPSRGVLLVLTEPAGSMVTVDGKQYGVTPLNLRLPIGTHQLVVTNGAGRHEENVEIENDQITTRSFRWQ
ncbi:MAG: serine/threonine-protein kinase [Bryobacteraceae bacterium]